MKQNCNGFILLFVLMLAVLLLSSCHLLYGEKFYIIGKVLADQDDFGERSGIAGARIEVGRSAVYSGANGEFAGWFRIPLSQPIQIKISRRGYKEEYYGSIMPTKGETIDLGNIFLRPDIFALAGAYGRLDLSLGSNRQSDPDNPPSLPFDVKAVPGVRKVPPFAEYEPGVVLVGFDPGDMAVQRADSLHQKAGTRLLERIENLNVDVVSAGRGGSLEETIAFYENLPGVRYAEPNYYAYALGSPEQMPNDRYIDYQWGLKNIDMPLAWGVCSEADDVLVAVLDTGMIIHEDLFPDPYRDWGNIRWDLGKDFVDGDDEPFDTDSSAASPSHGAHVAGIIGAVTDNGEGVAGVAWRVGIVPVRVLGKGGQGTHADIAKAIRYAADIGVDVINLSLGGRESSNTLRSACQYAHGKGVTLIAAAGNDGGAVFYPAAYDQVIAVAAVGPDGRRAPYSNYGLQIDVAAPGGYWPPGKEPGNNEEYDNLILSTSGYYHDPGDNFQGYYAMEGTSMAAPHVAGVAALMIANGTASTPEEIRQNLRMNGSPNEEHDYGLINAYSALGGQSICTFEVFAGKQEGNRIYLYSDTDYVSYPTYKNYRLRAIDPGNYNVFAWADWNGNGVIDGGDWFGKSRPVLFTAGADVNINLTVKDFGTYTLSDSPIEIVDMRNTSEE